MTSTYLDKHREKLDAAVAACASREYYSAYDESPSPRVYGETAAAEGKAAFEAWLGKPFPLQTAGSNGTVATERSPYGFDLGISYPRANDVSALTAVARAGMPAWRDAGPEARTGVCIEILERLHARVFELANAVQHTSGQAFVMAFQAGGAHALDRALEAIAYAWVEMTRTPSTAIWEKPGKVPVKMEKTFTVVPRGVALVIGCNTFPTWNSWPGLFASLVTGNAVVVKPHPSAVLPLAITVQACQEVLAEAGFDPNLVTLAAEDPGDHLAAELAVSPVVKLIDYTGGSAFGDWLEQHATQAVVFTEKAGVNTVVVDSTSDFTAMCFNLAFSFALYTGQMCTAPQNVYLPADRDRHRRGHQDAGRGRGRDRRGVREAARRRRPGGRAARWRRQLGGPGPARERRGEGRGVRRLADRHPPGVPRCHGAHAHDHRADRSRLRRLRGGVLRPGGVPDRDLRHRRVDPRCSATPCWPHGAMTASVYSTSDDVIEQMRDAALDAGVALSENLLGGVFVNQSAAYSDFHGTGANPAANASYTDGAYVASRFRVVQSRRHV